MQPYPASVRMLDVTAQCTEHSPLNVNRRPWKTEAMLEEVLKRVEQSAQLEVIVFENVPRAEGGARGMRCEGARRCRRRVREASARPPGPRGRRG